MEPNSYFIKVGGKANIPEPLTLGEGYKVVLDGEVVSESKHNTEHNGEFDVVYSFKPALCEVQDNYGKIIKAKDVRSRSAQLRRRLYRTWEADSGDIDSEEAYERTMKYILNNAEEIYEKAKHQ